ncbi:MAG: hypothetical protein WCK35_00755 [Chloroflexota bacterium]
MKTIKLSFVLLVIALVASTFFPAQAQGNTPNANWGDFFNTDGTVKAGVIDGGEISQPADWMPDVGPLANWGISMEATYHVYTAPDGSTMMTPSASTLFFMAMNPTASGLINANGEVGMGQGFAIQTAGSLAGGSTTPQQLLSGIFQALSGNSGITQVQADQFADALINNQGNSWAFLIPGTDTWNIFRQLLNTSMSDQNVYLLAMLYNSCSNSPTGCPAELCQANPVACGLPPTEVTPVTTPEATLTPPPSCPGPSISQAAPSLSITAGAPNYPLVVGQDPEKRGADVQASVAIPPVIYTWHEPIFETERVCRGGTNGIPQTCRNVQIFKGCRAHRETLPEQITSSRATATLSVASRNWIVSDLGSTWYGAFVHQGFFDLKRYGSPSTGCSGTCSFTLAALKVPFADPGVFDLLVSVNTAGTFFNGRAITNPRALSQTGKAKIWVVLPTLIDASSSGQ